MATENGAKWRMPPRLAVRAGALFFAAGAGIEYLFVVTGLYKDKTIDDILPRR